MEAHALVTRGVARHELARVMGEARASREESARAPCSVAHQSRAARGAIRNRAAVQRKCGAVAKKGASGSGVAAAAAHTCECLNSAVADVRVLQSDCAVPRVHCPARSFCARRCLICVIGSSDGMAIGECAVDQLESRKKHVDAAPILTKRTPVHQMDTLERKATPVSHVEMQAQAPGVNGGAFACAD